MPDWISHVLIGLILCEILDLRPKSLVLLGTLLPDLILKSELLQIFFPLGDRLYWVFMPLHTPIGLLLMSLLILPLFDYDRKKSFLLITLGWISHLLSDMLTKHFLIGEFLLFPFSWKTFGFGMIWPEEFYMILLPLIIIYAAVLVVKRAVPNKQ